MEKTNKTKRIVKYVLTVITIGLYALFFIPPWIMMDNLGFWPKFFGSLLVFPVFTIFIRLMWIMVYDEWGKEPTGNNLISRNRRLFH